jgi:Domain of unknown function (DUF4037)
MRMGSPAVPFAPRRTSATRRLAVLVDQPSGRVGLPGRRLVCHRLAGHSPAAPIGVTEGCVFADPHQELARLRRRFAWYPEPVPWWLVACQWRRLAQEEPGVQQAMRSAEHAEREAALCQAYRLLASRFNSLAGCSVDSSLRPCFDRPARVVGADRFALAALDRVSDRKLATRALSGSVDQLLDCTDVLSSPDRVSLLRSYYRASGFED